MNDIEALRREVKDAGDQMLASSETPDIALSFALDAITLPLLAIVEELVRIRITLEARDNAGR